MPIERVDIADDALESEILVMLENSGFAVDIQIDLVSMDGHRILEIIAPLRMPPVTFELASLMCTQGNISCHIAKFKPVEHLEENTHKVEAILTLYADHLSETELSRMLYLFIKEIDRVDDELVNMVDTQSNMKSLG